MFSSFEKVRFGLADPWEFQNTVRTRRVFDLKLSRTTTVDPVHNNFITSMDIDSSGRYLISVAYSNFAIHDTFNFSKDPIRTLKCVGKSGDQKNNFRGLATIQWFPNDPGLFTVSSGGGKVLLYNTNRLKTPVDEYGGTTSENFINHQMNPLSPHLIAALSVVPDSNSQQIVIIDIRAGTAIQTLPTSRNGPRGASLRADFNYTQLRWNPRKQNCLVGGTVAGQIIEWDIRSTYTYARTYSFKIPSFEVTPSNKRLKIDSEPEVLKGHGGKVKTLRFSSDGNDLYSFGCKGEIHRWDTWREKSPYMTYNLPRAAIQNFAPLDVFTSGKDTVLFAGWGHELYLINGNTGDIIRRFKDHFRPISSFVYDQVYQYGYSGGQDAAIIVYSPNDSSESLHLDSLKNPNQIDQLSETSKELLIDLSDDF